MGWTQLYCCLCATPLTDVREDWLDFLQVGDIWPPEDGNWRDNPPGFPVPTKPVDEIVTISEEDGQHWNDWVCVGALWTNEWVSSRSSHDGYEIFIDDSSDWQQQAMESPYFFIHRGCLSFLCRHTNITPQTLTDSLFGSESPHRQWGAEGNLGLLKYVKYELMDQRYGQFFEYAINTLDTSTGQFWDDPESMSDMQWALARPTVFPLLRPTSSFGVMKRTPPASSSLARLITIPELLNAILEHVVEITDQELADSVLNHPSIHDPTCLKLVTCTLLALSQVSSFFAMAILQERQGLFLRLARLYGWMLPVTPAEWASWPNARPLDLRLSTPFDWRAYVVTHLREEDPHARSRRRIYGMVTQFVKGTVDNDGRTWNVGKPNYRPGFEPPEPWGWEFEDDELNDVDEAEEMDEDEGAA